MQRLSYAMWSYIIAIATSIFIKLLLLAANDAQADFWNGEKYAGASLGLLFGGSLDDGSFDYEPITYTDSAVTIHTTASLSGTDGTDGISGMINGYVGIIDDTNIAFELAVNWMSNQHGGSGSDSFDILALFVNIGYDCYLLQTNAFDTTFFGQIGIGIANIYNIQGMYTISQTVSDGSGTNQYTTTNEFHGLSELGLGLRAKLGGRIPTSDYTSVSVGLSLLYITGFLSSSGGSAWIETKGVTLQRGYISNDNLTLWTAIIDVGIEMLVF